MSDSRLAAAVAAGEALGTGIGGRSAVLDVDGVRVFVKRVPLTDLEARHPGSTANLFALPLFFQYGIGSAGFGAWRELAAHRMTTAWVRSGAHGAFPELYHWRVLPDSPPAGMYDEFGGLDRAVAFWDGSAAVRTRLTAISEATASVVLFLEYVPWTLDAWSRANPAARLDGIEAQLTATTEFLSARGFVHFDAHFGNVLTDGERLRFADFGLATSTAFTLSAEETRFLTGHLRYDHACVVTELVTRARDRPDPTGIVARHGPTAAALLDFRRRVTDDKRVRFALPG